MVNKLVQLRQECTVIYTAAYFLSTIMFAVGIILTEQYQISLTVQTFHTEFFRAVYIIKINKHNQCLPLHYRKILFVDL